MGNMVGVSITNVGPAAGHVVAELLDLLIAVWSITVAGLVIGFVSGFAWVSALTGGADKLLSRMHAEVDDAPSLEALVSRVDEVDAKVGKLVAMVAKIEGNLVTVISSPN